MPVGTKGAIKGVTFQQMRELGCQILLGNTYHLGNYPGTEVLDNFSGLHNFEGWDRNILTDSGGFQMVSLLKLAQITEEGVEFESPTDGSRMLLTPEESMRIQNSIGADIMMALDDVTNPLSTKERLEEACHRTTRWIDRCILAHNPSKPQNLFGIVQGGLDTSLRDISLEGLISKNLPGYAIGGLAGGEAKEDFWKIVAHCTNKLPWEKPRYLMGVGYPIDLLVCSCLGVDMFDCVFATRTARFGQVFTKKGFLRLRPEEMKSDLSPLDESCNCPTCIKYTKSFLSTLLHKEQTACHLLSIHNIYFLFTLMREIREAIISGELEEYARNFVLEWFNGIENVPSWVKEALTEASISLN
mmetsp:Transcript_3486/g.3232  ORF Transcript_3486/g.3232 Transcript_3486/m.3232 type:complete len:358 (+) Transcript_3486:120-1193(+)